MPYPPLLDLADEAAFRAHFEATYCHGPIQTFDGIEVRFRKADFDHCCFESSQRDRNKDLFSPRRAQRLDWIKAALQDPHAERYQGWDKKRKRYNPKRRVTVVMDHFVVVIALKGRDRAFFVTAFVADTASARRRRSTIELIRSGPRWEQKNR